jgi:tellurite resistance protein TehA-like permease
MPPPPLAVEAGVMTRILRQKREVMIYLATVSIVVLTTLLLGKGNATVLLLTNKNESRAFPDMEAVFGTCKCSSSLLLLRLSNMPLNLSWIFVTTVEVGQNSRFRSSFAG